MGLRIDATSNGTSDVAAPLIGFVDLDQTFAIGEVTSPAHLATVPVGTLVQVDGSAAGDRLLVSSPQAGQVEVWALEAFLLD